MSNREHADSEPGINLDYRRCRNCGLDVPRDRIRADGWCSYCTGLEPNIAGDLRRAREATLKTAEVVLASKLARKDPEREVAWWRRRVAALRQSLGLKVTDAA